MVDRTRVDRIEEIETKNVINGLLSKEEDLMEGFLQLDYQMKEMENNLNPGQYNFGEMEEEIDWPIN